MAKRNKEVLPEETNVVTAFFEAYPKAEKALVVAGYVFLATAQKAADQYAAQNGWAVEVVLNPNLDKNNG